MTFIIGKDRNLRIEVRVETRDLNREVRLVLNPTSHQTTQFPADCQELANTAVECLEKTIRMAHKHMKSSDLDTNYTDFLTEDGTIGFEPCNFEVGDTFCQLDSVGETLNARNSSKQPLDGIQSELILISQVFLHPASHQIRPNIAAWQPYCFKFSPTQQTGMPPPRKNTKEIVIFSKCPENSKNLPYNYD